MTLLIKFVFCLMAFAFNFSVALAAPTTGGATNRGAIQKMASEYYTSAPQRGSFRQPFLAGEFRDHSSCVDEACGKMGCSFESDTLEVAKACQGNYGGGCVRAVCSKFSCSFKSDVLDVITACRQNFGGECVSVACSRTTCSFKSDVVDFANACQGADGECVRAVCDRTGCNFKSETLEAIKACKGN